MCLAIGEVIEPDRARAGGGDPLPSAAPGMHCPSCEGRASRRLLTRGQEGMHGRLHHAGRSFEFGRFGLP
jgi:hypothetical protein